MNRQHYWIGLSVVLVLGACVQQRSQPLTIALADMTTNTKQTIVNASTLPAIVANANNPLKVNTIQNISPNITQVPAKPLPPYSAKTWFLQSAEIDGKPLILNQTTISLVLGKDSFSGHSGINHYRGKLQRQRKNLHIDPILHISREIGALDKMRCESQYLDALRRVTHYQQDAQHLILSGEGVRLQYQKPR